MCQEDLLPITVQNQRIADDIRSAHRALLSEMKTKRGKKVDGGAFLKAWKIKLQGLKGDQSSSVKMKPKPSQRAWQRDISLRKRSLSSARSALSHQVVLPFGLKKVLVEDWEIINHFKMLHRLPASVTIGRALDLYMKSKGLEEGAVWFVPNTRKQKTDMFPSSDNEASLLNEWCDVATGVALLFEQALPFRLLYPSEHSQIAVMDGLEVYKDKPKIELYGCEFLLRMFCQLPAMLEDTFIAEDDISKMTSAKLNDFLRFINKNQSRFFTQSYRRQNDLELVYEKRIGKREILKQKLSHVPE